MPRESLDAGAVDLWDAYEKEPTDDARNALVEYYWPTVEKMVKRWASKIPPSALSSIDDMKSEAFFGLADAIRRFDRSLNLKFMTYAARRITGEMRDSLRRLDWVPRLERLRLKKGTAEEPPAVVSLSRLSAGEINRPYAIPERRASLESHVEMDVWREVLRGFSTQERLVVLLYYREALTMGRIGQSLGLSESRVSQIMTHLKPILVKRLEEGPDRPKTLSRMTPQRDHNRPKTPDVASPAADAQSGVPSSSPPDSASSTRERNEMTETITVPSADLQTINTTREVFIARHKPADIEKQIQLHENAIKAHQLEVEAWKAVLAVVSGQKPKAGPSTKDAVVDWLKKNGQGSCAEIAEAIGKKKTTVSVCLSQNEQFSNSEGGWRLVS